MLVQLQQPGFQQFIVLATIATVEYGIRKRSEQRLNHGTEGLHSLGSLSGCSFDFDLESKVVTQYHRGEHHHVLAEVIENMRSAAHVGGCVLPVAVSLHLLHCGLQAVQRDECPALSPEVDAAKEEVLLVPVGLSQQSVCTDGRSDEHRIVQRLALRCACERLQANGLPHDDLSA